MQFVMEVSEIGNIYRILFLYDRQVTAGFSYIHVVLFRELTSFSIPHFIGLFFFSSFLVKIIMFTKFIMYFQYFEYSQTCI